MDSMSMADPKTTGVLLAGGLAQRMGGDKALRPFDETTLIAHVLRRIVPQCDALIINANTDSLRFASYGLPVVADSIAGFRGPLAGIIAALEWTALQQPGCEWVVSAPTDCPFLPRDLVARLHAARRAARVPLAVAASGDQTHHAVGLWPVALRGELRQALLQDDMRKISRWTGRYQVATATWPLDPVDPFFNVNTPDELAEAERLARLVED